MRPRALLAALSAALAGCAGFPCGGSRCAARQYCVVTEYAQGAAPPPGTNGRTTTTSRCADQMPVSQGLLCSPTHGRYVSCTALIPARAPAR